MILITHVKRFFHISVRVTIGDLQIGEHSSKREVVGAMTPATRMLGGKAGIESCLAEIAARAAGSVMLSDGRSASSKNISSRPPGTRPVTARPMLMRWISEVPQLPGPLGRTLRSAAVGTPPQAFDDILTG